jgi:hypothetical protein
MIKVAQVGVSIDDAVAILTQVKNSEDDDIKYRELESLRTNVQSPQITQEIGNIMGSLQQNSDIKTVDPSSGKPYPTSNVLIDNLINQLKSMKKIEDNTMKVSENVFNFNKFAQAAGKKKKTRGNPFRVLMGKVGKLLDHGLEKREIVRYLLKENIWNEDTIAKAVNIVKEYNKKQHRKQKKVEAQTLPNTAEEWTRLKVDYSKRSNPELITSICWLNSLLKLDQKKNSFEKEVADRSGVKTMIREIKSELIKRGMSEESLNQMIK